MKKAAVIGNPVSHSLSPVIFELIAKHEAVPFEYDARNVSEEAIPSFFKNLREKKELIGVNVTIPHKETILKELDEVSDDVKVIGAVNTVLEYKSNQTPRRLGETKVNQEH